MIVQIIDFCDPNNQEKREDFWMYKLQTFYPEGLNIKIINKKWLELFCCLILMILKDLIIKGVFNWPVKDFFYCLILMDSKNFCYILTYPVKLLSKKL